MVFAVFKRKWRVVERSWFFATTATQCRMSFPVGCFGAGWILWRCEKEGNKASRET